MLIDTHILLWLYEGVVGHMGMETDALVKNNLTTCTVSMASFFEIKVKQRKGGLKQFSIIDLETKARLEGMSILDIGLEHLFSLPGKEIISHADPFDLVLIAQAVAEGVPFLTCDAAILKIAQPGLRLIDGRK